MKKAFLLVLLGVALALGLFVGTASADPTPGWSVQLPVLGYLGNTGGGDVIIEAQNVGNDFTKAVLVLWGPYRGFCEPQAPGPFKYECSGLLKPGAAWIWSEAQLPATAYGGIVFSAEHCPAALKWPWVGMAPPWANDVPLAVEVIRKFPGVDGDISAAYSGISPAMEGVYDPVYGGFMYYAPVVYAAANNLDSWLYIQNSGDECTSVELWFKQQDDCLRATICEVMALAPGETVAYPVSSCVGPGFLGSVWIRTSQPMGIVVDQVGDNVLMSYHAKPAQLQYVFNGEPFYSAGSEVAYGPLIYREEYGWDTRIYVQNLSSITNAKVKVYFIDNSGDIITTLVDWVCPRGNQTFFLPMVNNLPGNYVGQVRVESQEWWTPGDPKVLGPDIQAVAELIKYEGPARTTPLEAMAYTLVPEDQAFNWQLGDEHGARLIGIPSLHKRGSVGVSSELAVGNLNPNPGFTDFAMFIYDQNGLLDFVCEKLNEKQVEYINLNDWGYINPGFKGSAIIWGTFTTQDGGFGLGAVKVERSNTTLGVDIPGDESAASEGFPVFGPFGFEGPQIPVCPGQSPVDCGLAVVRGKVLDSAGKGIANATVALGLEGQVLFSDTTDASGEFIIANVPTPKAYEVTITAAGFATRTGVLFVPCTVTGAVFEVGNLSLVRLFGVSGTVGVLGANCAPDAEELRLAGATVELWRGNSLVASTKTNSEGQYSFANVAEGGPYHLKVLGEFEGNTLADPSANFNVAGNVTKNYNLSVLAWCP